MKKEIFTCDVCGAERKEANHWFAVEVLVGDPPLMLIRQWRGMTESADERHLCGQACVHKFVDEFLSK